ncbi:nuclease, putative [Ricinus communis]|uniref:Nuclease, putative n=1 Tax=Ricinus communis TaxID=3988 RepID=B9S0I2_RICCO|nr:nuclease, putative [Ricinus communis]
MEEAVHVVKDCVIAKQMWDGFLPTQLKGMFFALSLKDWVIHYINLDFTMKDNTVWKSLFGVAVWSLWNRRNRVVFNGEVPVHLLVKDIRTRVLELGGVMAWTSLTCGNVGLATAGGLVRNYLSGWICGFAVNIGACSNSSLIAEISRLLFRNWDIKLVHVYGEANYAADYLANYVGFLPVGYHFVPHPLGMLGYWLHHDAVVVPLSRAVVI